MKSKSLSICIPVYNRADIFKHSLENACKACLGFNEQVEIVVSDNNSDDDIENIFNDIQSKYKEINMIYHKNQNNIGMARNFLKVVELASGKFCWIIGCDDFIKKNSVSELTSIIETQKDISFISLNYDLLYLNKISSANNIEDKFTNISNYLEQDEFLHQHNSPTRDFKAKFDIMIDPVYNNVFLGAVMSGVFRKTLWDSVDKSKINWNDFNSLESIYPHCYIYAIAFIGTEAFYYGSPLITVGEGTREWGTDTGNSYWESSLPLIHFRILTNMIELYKENGLDKDQYIKCKKSVGQISGNLFIPIISSYVLKNMNIKNSELLNPMIIFRTHITNSGFYKGLFQFINNRIKFRKR